ncbi:VCBS domain-containing protein [Veronia pacifica]
MSATTRNALKNAYQRTFNTTPLEKYNKKTASREDIQTENAEDIPVILPNTEISGLYGVFTVVGGVAKYTENTEAIIPLNHGQVVSETFSVIASNGSTKTFSYSVTGLDDPCIVDGDFNGSLHESDAHSHIDGVLSIHDPDPSDNPVFNDVSMTGSYGEFSLVSHQWTYSPDPLLLEMLAQDETQHENFQLTATDGAQVELSIALTGQDTQTYLHGETHDTLEASATIAHGEIRAYDPDNPIQPTIDDISLLGHYGTFTLSNAPDNPAEKAWVYQVYPDKLVPLGGEELDTDVFTVAASDGTSHQIAMTVTGTDDTPVVSGIFSRATTETDSDQAPASTSGTLHIADADLTDTPSFVDTEISGHYGTLVLTNGQWTYTLEPDRSGHLTTGDSVTDTLTLIATDGTEQIITIAVNGTDTTAIIRGESQSTLLKHHTSGNGIVNLYDPDAETQPTLPDKQHAGNFGTLTTHTSGTWQYSVAPDDIRPLNDNEQAQDIFTITASDGSQHQIVITVTGADDAPVVSGLFSESVTETDSDETVASVSGTLNILDHDTADTPTFDGITQPGQYGSLVVSSGQWTYTLDRDKSGHLTTGDTLQDTLYLSATDGTQQIITIDITGSDTTATISGDRQSILQKTDTTDSGTVVFFDPDATTQPTLPNQQHAGIYGTLTTNSDGTWHYAISPASVATLNDNEQAQDPFTITASDGSQHQILITVTGDEDAPVVSGLFSAATTETDSDEAVASVSGSLAISDADNGDNPSFADTTVNGTYGDLVLTNGQWTYTLDRAGQAGQLTTGDIVNDTLTLTATDGTEQQITITITGSDTTAIISGNTQSTLLKTETSANGTVYLFDPDATAQPTLPNLTHAGTYGSLTTNSNGSWNYAANPAAVITLDNNEEALDSFTITASDGSQHQIIITVTGDEDAPIISGLFSAAVTETDSDESVASVTGSLTISDADRSDSPVFTDTTVVGTYGELVLTNGEWVYTLDRDDSGHLTASDTVTDELTLIATDGTEQEITITITGTDTTAIITGESQSTLQKTDITASGTVNLHDPDAITQPTLLNQLYTGTYGSLTTNIDGTWSYVTDPIAVAALNDNEQVQDDFTVTASDGLQHQIVMTVTGDEDASVFSGSISGAVTEDSHNLIAQGQLTITDDDTNDTPSLIDTSHNGQFGEFTFTNGNWTFTANNSALQPLDQGQSAQDIFTVNATDGNSEQVTITLTGVEDASSVGGTHTGSMTENGLGPFSISAETVTSGTTTTGTTSSHIQIAGVPYILTTTFNYDGLAALFRVENDGSLIETDRIFYDSSQSTAVTTSSGDISSNVQSYGLSLAALGNGVTMSNMYDVDGQTTLFLTSQNNGAISVWHVSDDGALSFHGGKTIGHSQPSVNGGIVSENILYEAPDGTFYLYATRPQNDRIDVLTYNPTTGAINETGSTVSAGDNTSSVNLLTHNGKTYLVAASNNTLNVYTIDDNNGGLAFESSHTPNLGNNHSVNAYQSKNGDAFIVASGADSQTSHLYQLENDGSITQLDTIDSGFSFHSSPTGVDNHVVFVCESESGGVDLFTIGANNRFQHLKHLSGFDNDGAVPQLVMSENGNYYLVDINGVITSQALTITDLTPQATGTLTISDADDNDTPTFQNTDVDGTYGSLSLTDGTWVYSATAHSVAPLTDGQVVQDTLTLTATDGTQQDIVITLTGVDFNTATSLTTLAGDGIINSTEASGTVNIEGQFGHAIASDTAEFVVNGSVFTYTFTETDIQNGGTFTIAVSGQDLAAVTTATLMLKRDGQTLLENDYNYSVDIDAPQAPATSVALSQIGNSTNTIGAADLNNGNITVAGSVSGEFTTGDTVTVSVGGSIIATGNIASNGAFDFSVDNSLLISDTSLTVTVNATDVAGNVGQITHTSAYTFTLTDFLSINPISADNTINLSESGTTLPISGQFSLAQVGDIAQTTINGQQYSHTLTSEDISNGGVFSIDVAGSALTNNNNLTVEIFRSSQKLFSKQHSYSTDLTAPGELVEGSQAIANTYTYNQQIKPTIASFSDGSYIVAWQSYGQDGDRWGIYGQRYDASGAKLGNEFQLHNNSHKDQQRVKIAVFSDDTFITVYDTNAGNDTNIAARRFGSDGTPLGPEFTINTNTYGSQAEPDITALANDRFVVTWRIDDGSGNGVACQLFNANGSTVGNEALVNTYTTSGQKWPKIAPFSDGGYVITWQSNNQDGHNKGVYAQRFDHLGDKVGVETLVNTTTSGEQSYPAVTVLNNESYVIVWRDYDTAAGTYDIQGQIFLSDGTPLGSEFQINTTTSNDNDDEQIDAPHITHLSDGGFAVTWSEIAYTYSGRNVYLQRFSASGDKVGDEIAVSESIGAPQSSDPYLTTTNNGQLLVTWSLDTGGTDDIVVKNYTLSTSLSITEVAGADFIVTDNELVADNVTIKGKAIGEFSDGDAVTIWVTGTQISTGNVDANGDFTTTVPISRLLDSSTLTVKLAASDTAGNVSSISSTADYSIDHDSFLTIDSVTPDNIVNIAESQATVAVTGQYSIASAGDIVDVTLNGKTYSHTITTAEANAGGYFTLSVNGSDLAADNSLLVSLNRDGAQITSRTSAYTVDVSAPTALTIGSEQTANTHLTNNQLYPTSAYFSDGSFVVLWESALQDGDGMGIFGQRYDNSGNKHGGEFQLNTTTTDNQSGVSLTVFPDDTFIAAWKSEHPTSSNVTEFLGRKFDSDGTPLTGELILKSSSESQHQLQITALSNNGYVTTWISEEKSSTYDIVSQHFDADNNKQGSEIIVSSDTSRNQWDPKVAVFSDGGYVVTWYAWSVYDGSHLDYRVFAQRFDSSGNKLGGVDTVHTTHKGDNHYPDITVLKDDSYVIVWQSENDRSNPTTYDIHGQRFYKDGTPYGSEFKANAVTADYGQNEKLQRPSVTGFNDGGFAIAWEFKDTSPDTSNIHLQRFSPLGEKIGDELTVSTGEAGYTARPDLSSHPDGTVLVAWGEKVAGHEDIKIRTLTMTTQLSIEGIGSNDYIVDNADLSAGNIPVTGKAIGEFSDGDAVTIWVGGTQIGSGSIDAAGNFSVGVSMSDILAHTELSAKLSASDTAGNLGIITASSAYSIDINSFLHINALTTDNTINIAESQANIDITGQYVLAKAGDTADIVVNGNSYLHTFTNAEVAAGGSFSIAVSGADLAADSDITVSVSSGGSEIISRTHQYDVDLFSPSVLGVGETVTANTHLPSFQGIPTLEHFSDGSYVVAWQSYDQDGDDYGIFAQHFDAKGNKVGSEYQLNTSTVDTQSDVSLSVFSDDTFIASWHSYHIGVSSPDDVMGRKFSQNGTPLTDELNFNVSTSSNYQTRVTALADDSYVLSWESAQVIKSQRFNTDDTKLGNETTVSTSSTARYAESGAFSDGGYVIAWFAGNVDGNSDGIVKQQFDNNGNKVGSETVVNTHVSGSQQYPSVAVLEDDSYVMVWLNDNQYSNTSDICGQRFNRDGSKIGTEFIINAETADDNQNEEVKYPDVTPLSDGGFVVVWEYLESNIDKTHVHAQRFSADGQKVGSELIASQNAPETYNARPHISASDNGKVTIAWGEYVDGTKDVMLKTYSLPITIEVTHIAGTDFTLDNTDKTTGTVTIEGKVFGDFSANDPFTLLTGGNQIGLGNIDAQGNFTTTVAFSDLKDHTALEVSVIATDESGNIGPSLSEQTAYSIDHDSFLIINAVTADNSVDITESQSAINITGHYALAEAGDIIEVSANGSSVNHTITSAEANAGGYFSVSLSGSDVFADGTLDASISRNSATLATKTHVYDKVPIVSSVSDVTVEEGQDAIFTITLSNTSNNISQIWIDAWNDSAVGVHDHAENLYADFNDGQGWQDKGDFTYGRWIDVPANISTFSVKIPTVDDNVYEGDESFTLRANAEGQSQVIGTATLTDNDSPPTLHGTGVKIQNGVENATSHGEGPGWQFTTTRPSDEDMNVTIAFNDYFYSGSFGNFEATLYAEDIDGNPLSPVGASNGLWNIVSYASGANFSVTLPAGHTALRVFLKPKETMCLRATSKYSPSHFSTALRATGKWPR